MIFISHNHKDKDIITPIADELAGIFGREKVFYDSWSIQPGDSLTGKIEEGLKNCEIFFLFLTKNSLQSKIVEIEWRNALLKSTEGLVKIVPVRLEKVDVPTILKDTVWIDAGNVSQDQLVRQIIDVASGNNIYDSDKTSSEFHNIVAYARKDGEETIIEFKAEKYLEPISKYAIILTNTKDEVAVTCPSEGHFSHGYAENMTLANGKKANVFRISLDRSTAVGFPLVISLKPKTDKEINLLGGMKAIDHQRYKSIPLVWD